MRLILHQAAKDLRAQRWPLAAWLALLTLLAVLAAFPPGWSLADPTASGRLYEGLAAFGWVLTVTGWFIAARIVQEDPVDRDQAFWVTRPLSPGALLAAKLAVILPAFLVLPTVTVVAVAAANGVGPSLLGWVAAGHLACSAAFLMVVLVIASITDGQARYLFGVVIAGLVYAVVHLLAFTHSGWLSRRPPLAGASGAALAVAIVICGGAAAITLQYFTRRTRRTATVAVVGLVVAVAIGDNWPWSFWPAGFFGRPPAIDGRALDRVRVSLDPASLHRTAEYRGRIGIVGRLRVDGLPPGLVAEVAGGRSRLLFDRGNTPFAADGSVEGFGRSTDLEQVAGDTPSALQAVMGARVGGRQLLLGAPLYLIDLPEPAFQAEQDVPADFRASLRLQLARIVVGEPLPLVDGASGRVGNVRLAVVQVAGVIVIREVHPDLLLRPAEPVVYFLARKRGRDEVLLLSPRTQPATPVGLPWSGLKESHTVLGGIPDAVSSSDVELVPVTLERMGVFEKQLKVENFVLPTMSGR